MDQSKTKNFWALILSLLILIAGGIFLVSSLLNLSKSNIQLSPTPDTLSVQNYEKANLENSQQAQVIKVIDGDTIEVSINNQNFKVRYIGIDTPETVDPRRPVGCFGAEASKENKKLVEGRQVFLVKDVSETDNFDRLLRYVYVEREDKTIIFVNDNLVRNGFAKSSTYPPDVKFQEQFLEAQTEAMDASRGLWGKC